MLRDRRVLAEVKRAEPHGVDQVLVLLEELDGGPGLVARLAWEAEKSHRVIPDSDVGRQLQTFMNDLLGRGLVHEFEHALVPGLIAEMQIAATGRPGVLPDGFLQQALLEPHVGLPENVHIFFDQLLAEFPEKSWRIGLVRKMEMLVMVLSLERADFLDDLLDSLRAITSRVTFV